MERKERRQVLLLRQEFEYNHEDNLWCRCPGPLTANPVSLKQVINALFLSLSLLLCRHGRLHLLASLDFLSSWQSYREEEM